ncbi:MAG: ATP-dependent endonuclease, partial [Candidatus Competibacteraceae bacterium]|nr:ATP-dependent endonuclease [Candidatus Competibacteraceae bacterium]
EVQARFADYHIEDCVSLHTGTDPKLNTLEPQIVAVNELATLNAVFGTNCETKDQVLEAMLANKTGSALAIFESEVSINMPEYIRNALGE